MFMLIKQELKFAARDRSVWLWMAMIVFLSLISLGFGLAEVRQQNTSIQELIKANEKERIAESKKFTNWGSAAYYGFHVTYDSPSKFSFAALGQRDLHPWKHRIRMLALEGQIYERDVTNPSVALIGRFDFAFFAAFIFPLILIMLLYDLRASERTAGRYHLLVATAGNAGSLWFARTCVRAAAAFACLVAPLIINGLFAGVSVSTLFFASVALLVFGLFWSGLSYFVSIWNKPSAVILTTLIAIWLATTVVIPAGARIAIDKAVPLPSGSEILLLQRETVNAAWDLPQEATMNVFYDRHPEWRGYTHNGERFDWPWYYAFQQVGDQKTEVLSQAYRSGRIQRDKLASLVAIFAPSSWLERTLQSLANTDAQASIKYEDNVRAYHAQLRDFYYPKFFRHHAFDRKTLNALPRYNP